MTVPGTKARAYPCALSHEATQSLLHEYAAEAAKRGVASPAAIAIRNKIVAGHLGLIFAVWKAHGRRVPHDDVLGIGSQGLIKAVERFDVSRGLRFSTYAMHWIRHALGRTQANEGSMIRIPVHAQAGAKTAQCRDAAEAARRVQSLDVPLADDARESHASMIVDADALAAFDAVDEQRQAAEIARAVARLPEAHRSLIALRRQGLTLAESAARLRVTRERARHLEHEALAQLRRALREAA